MKWCLYLLVFEDGKHFKIGIAETKLKRISLLSKVYKIDFRKSFLVEAPKSVVIKTLEKELLEIFPNDDIDPFKTDGHTEIRSLKYLNECVDIIKNKHKNLNISTRKFSDDDLYEKVKIKKPGLDIDFYLYDIYYIQYFANIAVFKYFFKILELDLTATKKLVERLPDKTSTLYEYSIEMAESKYKDRLKQKLDISKECFYVIPFQHKSKRTDLMLTDRLHFSLRIEPKEIRLSFIDDNRVIYPEYIEDMKYFRKVLKEVKSM